MKNERKRKDFMECLFNFLSDTEELSYEEIRAELSDQGIDTDKLEMRIKEIAKKGSKERRLSWVEKAREKREKIKKKLESMKISGKAEDMKKKIIEILKGSHGSAPRSYVEAYFRKIESLSEEDLESLIEDIERLNLLEELDENEK